VETQAELDAPLASPSANDPGTSTGTSSPPADTVYVAESEPAEEELPRLLVFSTPEVWHASPTVKLTERYAEYDDESESGVPLVIEILDEVLRDFTDEQIADAYDDLVREVTWSTTLPDRVLACLPDRDALLALLRECRIDTPYEHGPLPLPLERQVDEHNEMCDGFGTIAGFSYLKVENGKVVSDVQRRQQAWAWEQERRAARVMAVRKSALGAPARTLVRRRDRGRARRSRRATSWASARAPDRPPRPSDSDLARLGRASRRRGAS
jgi:hypothetical protein